MARGDLHLNERAVAIVTANRQAHGCTLPRVRDCATPECTEAAGFGNTGLFCVAHAEVLARVRASLSIDIKRIGRYHQQRGRAGRTQAATCCNPHCWNPRDQGHAFCTDCEGAGWKQEAEE